MHSGPLHAEKIDSVGLLCRGLAVGLAGGLAEILVVRIYDSAAGIAATRVAAGIATAVHLNAASALTGLFVHMALALVLGVLLVVAGTVSGVLKSTAATPIFVSAVLALVVVWAINFLIVLPVLSPGFLMLLPYPVTLLSKTMFGVAAAATWRASAGAPGWLSPAIRSITTWSTPRTARASLTP